MRMNTARKPQVNQTHEGGDTTLRLTPEQQLRRCVLACLLGESQFYESGQSLMDRISDLAKQVKPEVLATVAVEARKQHNLRHVPLYLLTALLGKRVGSAMVGDTIAEVVSRADEMGELIAHYWAVNGQDAPLPKQLKLGLAKAFGKFDAYQLGKYNRKTAITLLDVMRLVHPKPRDAEQSALWASLRDGTLPSPDTWEVALSGGADKRETFSRLLAEDKLGYMALLRNLRNMTQAGVDTALIREAILARKGAHRVLPFRFVAAARACPQLEPSLDQALLANISESPQLPGRTVVLVDVSGSMDWKLSEKSDLTRLDAAAALASVINAEELRVLTFSQNVVEVAPRRGMAGVEAVVNSQIHGGTWLGGAIDYVNKNVPHDRLIVITDEQSADRVGAPSCARGYMINVASYKHGVGYGPWVRIDGFSEQVIRYIQEYEGQF